MNRQKDGWVVGGKDERLDGQKALFKAELGTYLSGMSEVAGFIP